MAKNLEVEEVFVEGHRFLIARPDSKPGQKGERRWQGKLGKCGDTGMLNADAVELKGFKCFPRASLHVFRRPEYALTSGKETVLRQDDAHRHAVIRKPCKAHRQGQSWN